MMIRYQIVDLDGCISDDRWRRCLIQPDLVGQARFAKYHGLCDRDVAANLGEVDPRYGIIVVTARPICEREKTERWLNIVAGLSVSILLMRNDDETKASLDLKRMMLSWLFDANMYAIQPEQIVSAIDDRQVIVDMYRDAFGLDSRLVRIGDEEHQYA